MAGFTVSATNVRNPNTAGDAIVTALTSANATIWFAPLHAAIEVPATGTKTQKKILLESTDDVDAFVTTNPNQTYRMLVTFDYNTVAENGNAPGTVYTAMKIQFGNAQQISLLSDNTDVLVASGTPTINVFTPTYRPAPTAEFNWRISFTSRGVAFGMWKTSKVNKVPNNCMFVIQRPVNPTTGATKITGNAPIFAFWHGAEQTTNYFQWAIVRELDRDASLMIGNTSTVSRTNMYKLTMDWSHPNLFDNNSHVVKFPYGLATGRHLYLDELDMICMVSASAFASQQLVGITMYGEASERKYTTAWGEVLYGNIIGVQQPQPKIVSGARIGILTQNGGI